MRDKKLEETDCVMGRHLKDNADFSSDNYQVFSYWVAEFVINL